MEIYTSVDPIKRLIRFNLLDHPVALTASLNADDQVIIGLQISHGKLVLMP